jgi:predicted Na+-dependent transporter
MLKSIKYLLGKINQFLERMIAFTTPFGIVLGFLLPSVFVNLRPFIPYLFGLMTFSGALKLRARDLGSAVSKPVPILLFFAAAYVIMPVIAMLASSLFFDNLDIIAGFILLFSGPTGVSSFIWVSILKGDLALCLTLILLGTLLAPLVVPGSVSILMGAKVAMNISGIAIFLLFMVVVPTIIGVVINETSKGKLSVSICSYVDPLARICLMTVIAINASIVAPSVKFNDPLIWKTTALVIVLTFVAYGIIKLTTVISKCKSPKDISLIICGGLRNNSAILTIAVAFFPKATVLPILISIVVQQIITAIMGKAFTGGIMQKRRETREKSS